MSTAFKTSSKTTPCPVCNRDKDQDCRILEGGNLILCHTHQTPAEIPGYHFVRKSDKGAGWGVWMPEKPKKTDRAPQSKPVEFIYQDRNGKPLAKVSRQNRKFWQSHWNGKTWVNGLPDEIKPQVPVYRYPEIRQAIEDGQAIWWVEGEGVADALWRLGLPATTTIGGCGGYENYGSYQTDLAGAAMVVLCPDRDMDGMKYMNAVAKDYPEAQWCKVYPKSPWWDRLPAHGGIDAVDWINEGATVNDFLSAIQDENPAQKEDEPTQIDRQSICDEAQRLKLDLQYFLKETDRVQKIVTLNRICTNYRISKQTVSDLIAALEEDNNPIDRWRFSGKEFFEQETDAIDYLIPRYLPAGESILLCSDAGVGKTALVTDMVHAILSGTEFLGEKVAKPGKCLVISSDESPRSTRRRFIARGIDMALVENLEIWTRLDITQLDDLERHLEDRRPDVVFIDSITTVCQNVGISEKDPEFARYLYKLKGLVNRYNAALVVIHHANKDPLARGIKKVSGSARIPAAFWGVFLLERWDDKNPEHPYRILDMVKSRETETFKVKLLIHQRHEWMQTGIFSFEDDTGAEKEYKSRSQQVLDLLRQYTPSGLEYQEIATALGLQGNYLYRLLDRLEDARLIGKRRSESDKRRWVYFVNPPSPPQTLTLVEQYPETYIEQETQRSENLTPVINDEEITPLSLPISRSSNFDKDQQTEGESVEKNLAPDMCGEDGCKNSNLCYDCVSDSSSTSGRVLEGESPLPPTRDAKPKHPRRNPSLAPRITPELLEHIRSLPTIGIDEDGHEVF